MAALSSVPWVGGLISATASLYSEKDQSKVNVLPITENAKRPWRALVCRCHGPAFPRNRPKRLRKSSRCWDTPSGCHGPASAAGSDVFSLGRLSLRWSRLGHDGAMSRAGLGADSPEITRESAWILGQPSRAGLAGLAVTAAR